MRLFQFSGRIAEGSWRGSPRRIPLTSLYYYVTNYIFTGLCLRQRVWQGEGRIDPNMDFGIFLDGDGGRELTNKADKSFRISKG